MNLSLSFSALIGGWLVEWFVVTVGMCVSGVSSGGHQRHNHVLRWLGGDERVPQLRSTSVGSVPGLRQLPQPGGGSVVPRHDCFWCRGMLSLSLSLCPTPVFVFCMCACGQV